MTPKNSQASIYLDKPYYVVGDIVDGVIALDIMKPLVIQDMLLSISGIESSYIKQGDKRYSTSAQVLNHNILIFDGILEFQIGRYHFPFHFELPVGIPGTLRKSSSNYIKYSLEISPHVQKKAASLDCTKPLVVIESLSLPLSPLSSHSDRNIPKFMCCGSNGSVAIIIDLDKNAYFPGEQVNIHIFIDNSGSISGIKKLKLSLTQVHRISVGSRHEVNTIALWSTRIREKVDPGGKLEFNYSFTIPDHMQYSSTGVLHHISHSVTLELDVPWSCGVSTNAPIQIFRPSLPPSADMFTEPYNDIMINQKTRIFLSEFKPTIFQKLTTLPLVPYPQ